MSVRMSETEAWDMLEACHTGILTTIRADGSPITLPVWFVVLDRTIGMRTPPRTKKLQRIKRDPRASFLVETGEKWAELRAVHLSGSVITVDDEDLQQQIGHAMDEKYAAYRTERSAMTESAQATYAQFTYLQFLPTARMLTWDNHKLSP